MAYAPGQVFQYFALYGTQFTAVFTVMDPVSANGDLATLATLVAAGITVSKDGGAPAPTTNNAARLGTFHYTLVLTAAEMQANTVVVAVRDSTAAETYGPATLIITTVLNISQFNIDASNLTNQPAMKLQGVGTGEGLRATGGATAHGIRGAGQGTGYGISGGGASTVFNTDLFNTLPAAEAITVPTDLLSYGTQMQALTKRFYNKVTQDASLQKVYRNDGASLFTSMLVSDDGTTQVKGQAA